jgi:signal transduction histidine kinase/CheY-like chemotaxis protein
MRKTYDYRAKVAEARLPWLIGAVVLALCVIALIFILFQRGRQHRRHLENKVRIRTAELKAVIDNYKGVIWSVDSGRNVTIFGGQLLKKLKLQPSFIVDKNVEAARFRNMHLDILENIEKTFKGGAQDWISEIDGVLYHSNTTPVYDMAGKVISVIGSNDDMTELFTLQQNLQTAKEAQAANQAKNYFLAAMSHEMRTPMNVIIGMTSIGKNSKDIERKDYAFSKIGDAAVHLLSVINDVLDTSKINANKMEISPVEFNLEKMLQKIVNIINFSLKEKNHSFTLKVDQNIPRCIIGDDYHLSQVIMKLLLNAVKFSPENGEIGLDISLESEKDGICEIRAEVSDNGIGITPEQQVKLFCAFEQVDGGFDREFGGTGLGLSISKNIVALMGGEIWVESEHGKGSRFIFTVKVGRGKENAASMPASVVEPEIGEDARFAGKKLLVVEDVEINREILLSLLEDTGLSIDCAGNGREAVDLIAASPTQYDMILMDVQMPKMDGLEATRRIRSMTAGRMEKFPIIAMTAHVFASDIEECLAAGMDDHIGKPFDIDDVLKKLQEYLSPEMG